MNILLITLSSFEDINKRGIYTDLVRTLSDQCEVYVVSPREKRTGLETELSDLGNIKILKVETGNITKYKNFIEKGISTLRIESLYMKAIKKHFKDVKFDMIMYSTPPITFTKIIKHYMQTQNSKTYLILKDIFPQNAVDIGLIKENGFLHKHFRKKEINLYKISDHIGCMSQGNVNYILKHNPWLDKDKVEVFPNAIIPIERRENKTKDLNILDKYKIPHDSVIFIYGGNLGKPQGIDFVIEVIDNFHKVENGFLLIVGSGTEYNKIEKHIASNKPTNVAMYQYLPKDEYDKLVAQSDVGLIFLDKRFTIPNFPSRLTAYMENSMPILAATDTVTDIKDVLLESQSGLWSESGEIKDFILNANILAFDHTIRKRYGKKSREYIEEYYDIRKCVNLITDKL
jgi:glycosyltransferase involved in cell wall biosynthesis